ncbi:MAG TPA: entericidin A/B family lipoprotein [Phycisphaeraceae bacterium]
MSRWVRLTGWWFQAVLILLVCLAIGGCNTIAGIGKDIQSAGEAMQEAAD